MVESFSIHHAGSNPWNTVLAPPGADSYMAQDQELAPKVRQAAGGTTHKGSPPRGRAMLLLCTLE